MNKTECTVCLLLKLFQKSKMVKHLLFIATMTNMLILQIFQKELQVSTLLLLQNVASTKIHYFTVQLEREILHSILFSISTSHSCTQSTSNNFVTLTVLDSMCSRVKIGDVGS
jgi:hypothetical protein